MGYKVKEAREAKGITQQELAERSGVSRTIIAGLESGAIGNTTIATLVGLAKALGVNVTDIFFADVV
ncbi:MAG: helix-turn-helix transcriptional regulator [Candidatus Pelethousia sp.]|nr:helix-turn-helix transcriptional regulator [Candidatus Pelethousia sp.]